VCSSQSFPPDTSLPFTLSKDSTHYLYRICEVQLYVRDKALQYVIVLPLVKKPTQRTGQKSFSCLNTTSNSVLTFVIASVLMIFIMYKLYMYLRKDCNNIPRRRIEPKVLGKLLPPVELSNQGNAVNIKGIST